LPALTENVSRNAMLMRSIARTPLPNPDKTLILDVKFPETRCRVGKGKNLATTGVTKRMLRIRSAIA
jgi:hypothetical protein